MTETAYRRSKSTTPDVEARELEWWQMFAEVEERFSWVQTPPMQRVLRGRYVREIVRTAGERGSILELGCGGGWLSFVLAQAGAAKVVGVDFSSAQIEIANQRAAKLGLCGRVQFFCADGTQSGFPSELYDCVVVHGFLHHLDQSEIARTIANIPKLLKPGGVFIVFEPVRHGVYDASRPLTKWERRLYFLIRLANAGQRFGIRKIAPEERAWRDLLGRRNFEQPPHGPSPKELPFEPGELEHFLQSHFRIQRQVVCMAISHLVVQEWLLRAISHPLSTSFLLPIMARLAAKWDYTLVTREKPVPGLWSFTMFVCRPRIQDDCY